MTKVGQRLRCSIDIELGPGGLPPALASMAPAMWAAGPAAMLGLLPQQITNGFANRPSGLPRMGNANGMLGIRDVTGNPRQAHGVQHAAPAQGQQAGDINAAFQRCVLHSEYRLCGPDSFCLIRHVAWCNACKLYAVSLMNGES